MTSVLRKRSCVRCVSSEESDRNGLPGVMTDPLKGVLHGESVMEGESFCGLLWQ